MNNDIIPIWQPQGYSTNHLAKLVGDIRGVKATHTGTLDPMAEGVVIVLLDESRLLRDTKSSSIKGYEFEILFGLSTDSFDGLGYITANNLDNNIVINEEDINKTCKTFLGSYSQTVPVFSAQLYKGKKLFEWGHQRIQVPLPKKTGEIFKFDLLELRLVPLIDQIHTLVTKIDNIYGNFRQEEVKSAWKDFINTVPTSLKVYKAKFYVETSRGLYIRSLSQDLCQKLGTTGFITSLIRTRNGDFTKNDCVTLPTLFGENYANIFKLPH